MSALVSTAQSAPIAVEVDDSELVRRVRRGDERAFEQLYHRYHRRITAYIHGMVHDHARSEDVAQDVFVSALRRMRETDRPIAFKPWIYEIAKNACIDQFRRSRRAEEVSYDAEEGLGAADYGRLVSADAMPEARLESKQNLDHLRGAFGGLSETHHEILVMRELEGLSYREIGERLGMSRPSVESTLFRARRRLTEEYEELISGARCQRIQSIIATAAGTVLGARDQRRLARHVSHCQPCRRQARLAGLDIPVTPSRPVRQRIAAFLPLPLFLRRRWTGESADASSIGSSHVGGFAQWSAQFGYTVDPSWLKAAATAATVALAGAGAGLAGRTSTPTSPVGTFDEIVSNLGSGGPGDRTALSASETRSVAAALRAAAAPAAAITVAAASPTTPGRADRVSDAVAQSGSGNANTTGAGATSGAADTPGVPAPDTGLQQVTAGIPSGGGGSSGPLDPSTGAPQSNANASAPAVAIPGAPSAPAGPSATPPDTSSGPAAPNPQAPPVDTSAPDPTAAADHVSGAAGDVGSGLGGLAGGG
ncbi:MAG: hypothetical protein QOG68_1612 [Solirubrobacteraceae bacterium]|nr:hypothetical protein [Solirubrobacteraceae bacterium]